MNKIAVIAALLLISMPVWAYEERNLLQRTADPDRLAKVLVRDQKWVAYPDYHDRKGWRALMGDNIAAVVAEGEKALGYEWRVVRLSDYLDYARTGNRATQERPHNANIEAVMSLFMAEMAEGKGRFVDQLADGVFHLCEMTTWSIAAHLANQRVRGAFPNLDDHVIELVSSDLGATLSWIHHFLGSEFDKIDPLLSQRLRHEIKSRILDPYLEESRFWWMATKVSAQAPTMVNNWNVWCNANVLQCFLLMERDRERLSRGVYKTMVSVDKFINYNNLDGACEEGPSYWGHAAGKLYDYLQVLCDATSGEVSIFSEPLVRNMGEYISRSYVCNGWVVNFADASARERLDYRLIHRYGAAVGSVEMERFASHLKSDFARAVPVGRDAYRILADLVCDGRIERAESTHTATPFTWYPATQFCYMSAGGWFFAAKGGYNDESHNHNDVGTFSLYEGGEPVLIDAGVGTYTAKTFSSERYTIWTMQSDYHNLPRINGFQQRFGKKYRSANSTIDARRRNFTLDISQAYPDEADIVAWKRSYDLTKRGLEITEDFAIDGARIANRLHFMTWGEVDLSRPGDVKITLKGKTYRLSFDARSFDAESETIPLDDVRLSKVWGERVTRISLVAREIVDRSRYRILIDKSPKPQL